MTEYIDSREWWVERWLELLNSYRFKKRLERARRYANEGNVKTIQFKGSKVLAKVKGSDPAPYQVSLSLTPFSNEDWGYAIETMSEKALFSAQLLAGEMPANIEAVFTANGLSLFPFTLADIHSRCTCPDKANPCKHIGAVYYQLADRFSEDPFVLFQLRGRTRSQILATLRQLRSPGQGKKGKKGQQKLAKLDSSSADRAAAQTPLTIEGFWQYDRPLESSLVSIARRSGTEIASSGDGKTLLDLLGTIPLASAEATAVRQFLEQVYQTASRKAAIAASNQDES